MNISVKVLCENCYNIEKDKGPRAMKTETVNGEILCTCPRCKKQVTVSVEVKA